MNVLLGIGAVGVLYVLLEKQQLAILAKIGGTRAYAGVQPAGSRPAGMPTFGSPGGGGDSGFGLGSDVSMGAAGFQDFAGLASSGALGEGLQGASAIPIAGAIIAPVAQIITKLWAAHQARLKGAQTENQADQAVTAFFDQGVSAIVDYWNRTHDRAGTLAEIDQFDHSVYTYLRSRVGAAGTAWTDSPHQCDKACTVGCCLWWNAFGQEGANGFGIYGLRQAVSNGGNATVLMNKVYPSKYSSFTRPLYSVRLT